MKSFNNIDNNLIGTSAGIGPNNEISQEAAPNRVISIAAQMATILPNFRNKFENLEENFPTLDKLLSTFHPNEFKTIESIRLKDIEFDKHLEAAFKHSKELLSSILKLERQLLKPLLSHNNYQIKALDLEISHPGYQKLIQSLEQKTKTSLAILSDGVNLSEDNFETIIEIYKQAQIKYTDIKTSMLKALIDGVEIPSSELMPDDQLLISVDDFYNPLINFINEAKTQNINFGNSLIVPLRYKYSSIIIN